MGDGGGAAAEVNAHNTTPSDVRMMKFATFQRRRETLQRNVGRGVHVRA